MIRKGISRAQNTHRFNMVMTEVDMLRLDNFRRSEPDLPSRSEAVRRLIHRAATEG